MVRLGRANAEARERALRSLTDADAARMMEAFLSHPAYPPTARADHPVSVSRRLRGPHV